MNPKVSIQLGFPSVDESIQPDAFVRLVEAANEFPFIKRIRSMMAELLKVAEGGRIADVACGVGAHTRWLAERVAHNGIVVGVDASQAMLERAKLKKGNGAAKVKYVRAVAEQLCFHNEVFDSCQAERLLVHVSNPKIVLTEMLRIIRQGGRIVVCEPDMETTVLDPADHRVTRLILNLRSNTAQSGWVGRQLGRMFRQMEMKDIVINAETLILHRFSDASEFIGLEALLKQAQSLSLISPYDGQRFISDLTEADINDSFLFTQTYFVVSGTKS